MTAMQKIVARVIQRRLGAGESWDQVVADYPKLTDDDLAQIKEYIGVVA